MVNFLKKNKLNNRIENLREADRQLQIENQKPIINKDTKEQHIYLDKSTKGLKARYVVRKRHKTYRFRDIEEAKKMRDKLWKK